MSKRTSKFSFFMAFFLLGIFALAQLNSTEVKKLKQNINSATANLNSLQSDFFQTKHLDFMENDVKSSGKLFYKATSKIRGIVFHKKSGRDRSRP